MKHRDVDYGVEEDVPGQWRWIIYPKIEHGQRSPAPPTSIVGKPQSRLALKRSTTALRGSGAARRRRRKSNDPDRKEQHWGKRKLKRDE
jgi:hypothetical protein